MFTVTKSGKTRKYRKVSTALKALKAGLRKKGRKVTMVSKDAYKPAKRRKRR